jgi:hypothetical protein
MQKLLRQPVWAPSFALLGIVLVYMEYSTRARGFIAFIPEQGPQEIISATHRPGLYWLLTSGAMIVGVLCLALSAGAAYLLIRGIREEGFAPIFATNLFGKIAFAIGLVVMLAVLIVGKCSHQ